MVSLEAAEAVGEGGERAVLDRLLKPLVPDPQGALRRHRVAVDDAINSDV